MLSSHWNKFYDMLTLFVCLVDAGIVCCCCVFLTATADSPGSTAVRRRWKLWFLSFTPFASFATLRVNHPMRVPKNLSRSLLVLDSIRGHPSASCGGRKYKHINPLHPPLAVGTERDSSLLRSPTHTPQPPRTAPRPFCSGLWELCTWAVKMRSGWPPFPSP